MMFVICEFEMALRFPNVADRFTAYMLPALLVFPVVNGWMTRQRLVKWEARGKISAAVAAQVASATSVLVLLVFVLMRVVRGSGHSHAYGS
jgi:hypothetical protein